MEELKADIQMLFDFFKQQLESIKDKLTLLERVIRTIGGATDGRKVKVTEPKPFCHCSESKVVKLPLGYGAVLRCHPYSSGGTGEVWSSTLLSSIL